MSHKTNKTNAKKLVLVSNKKLQDAVLADLATQAQDLLLFRGDGSTLNFIGGNILKALVHGSNQLHIAAGWNPIDKMARAAGLLLAGSKGRYISVIEDQVLVDLIEVEDTCAVTSYSDTFITVVAAYQLGIIDSKPGRIVCTNKDFEKIKEAAKTPVEFVDSEGNDVTHVIDPSVWDEFTHLGGSTDVEVFQGHLIVARDERDNPALFLRS